MDVVATSKALADGRDMSEIGLMRDIAQRTVAVLADDARIYRPAAMSDALRKAPRRLTKRFGWCLGRRAPKSACSGSARVGASLITAWLEVRILPAPPPPLSHVRVAGRARSAPCPVFTRRTPSLRLQSILS